MSQENIAATVLRIEGMDCPACVGKIEKALGRVKGIKETTLSLASKRATVLYDTRETTLSAIMRVIADLGYRVQEWQQARGHAKRNTAGRLGRFLRIGFVGVVILLSLSKIPVPWLPFDIVILAVLVGGLPVARECFLSIRARAITVDTPFTIAIVASLVIGQYLTAAVLVFWMLTGKLFDEFTAQKSRSAIEDLLRLTPKLARIRRDGRELEVEVDKIRLNDTVIIRPGETVPVDGRVSGGGGCVDQSAITGEFLPVEKAVGDTVFAGTLNQLGALQVTAVKTGEATTLAKVIKLVEEAEHSKASVQRLADRFAAFFAPSVLAASMVAYLFTHKIMTALSVLVVACPCAVALAAPLAIIASSGRAARRGIIIKGGLYLEILAKIDTVVLDKTGTITTGRPRVTDIIPQADLDKQGVLQLAASAERFSEHPLASALLTEAERHSVRILEPDKFEAVRGRGVIAGISGEEIILGSLAFFEERSIAITSRAREDASRLETRGKTVLFVAQDAEIKGIIGVADTIKDVVPETIAKLREMGIKQFVMLTGDNHTAAGTLARKLGIEYRAGLLPQQKVDEIKNMQSRGNKVLMVGDGINDAPALAQADIGIAMGVAGADLAIEAADIILMRDDLRQIPAVIQIGRRTFKIIRQNFVEAVIFNGVGITLAAAGILPPAIAAAAHLLPDIAVFANSSRLFGEKRPRADLESQPKKQKGGENYVHGMPSEREVRVCATVEKL